MSDDRVRLLLHPSDDLKCLLDVKTKSDANRLIALLAHRDSVHQTDLGSILVLSHSTSSGSLTVVDALPITERLALQVAQTRLIDSHKEGSDLNVATEMSSAWLLTIRRDTQDTRPLECIVGARDTPRLQSWTAEYRLLKEIATKIHPVGTDFTWIDSYFLDPSSRRPDLRLRKQSLHSRLSSAVIGFHGDDALDISIVQRDWIERVATKETSSQDVKHLKIRLGSFNVNGKTPSQDLYTWLRGPGSQSQLKTGWISPLKLSPFEVSSGMFNQDPDENDPLVDGMHEPTFGEPDMLVLGFQELDLSAEALLYTTSTLREDEWLTAVFAGLGEKCVLYEKLTSRQLVGMLIMVIVRKALIPCFTDVRSCDAGSGIMGFMGNKGATAVRLKFTPNDPQIATCRSTILTFVNAHLAALDEMVERRNYDFQELSGRLSFAPSWLSDSYSSSSSAGDTYNIYQSDVLFWMGGKFIIYTSQRPYMFVDLNYRLNLPDEDIRKLLFSRTSGLETIQTLLSYDQLRAAIRSNKAFMGFSEHHITHIPTYRLALGATKDQLGYDMKRKPAWTDRILYMAPPDISVTCIAYRSHPEITMSDHKPVSADFDVSLVLVDQLQYENRLSALRRELAVHGDSELRPKIKVQPTSIEFGTVGYKQTIHREVLIQNEGEVPCVFRFVGTGTNSDHVCPLWLHIEPIVGLLRPQEATTVVLSACVDNGLASQLNLGSTTLDCTLVLHTALGKDDFITVSGHYQYTCFANTLERLTRLAGPIRKLKSAEDVVPAEQAANAPREIMRLINWLMTHVSSTEMLFEYPAQERLCRIIRECLDTGDEFPSEGLEKDFPVLAAAFAGTLVSLLDSLTEPVVPVRLHARCVQVRDKDEAFEVLNVFPRESINVWISLTAFLHYVIRQGDKKSASPRLAHTLANIFAPVLLRDDPMGIYPKASPVGKCEFLLLFIN